jgi:hypothetical protein
MMFPASPLPLLSGNNVLIINIYKTKTYTLVLVTKLLLSYSVFNGLDILVTKSFTK